MKRLIYFTLVAAALGFTACNKFLDDLPDKRAELNTPEKCAQLLVSAYSTGLPVLMFELMSDNVDDNGPNYSVYYTGDMIVQSYYFMEYTYTSNDSPTQFWQNTYQSISSANQVLEAIEQLNDPDATDGIKAEALLCRAFGHFMLVNAFSIAYNPVSSEQDMGIPYVEKPETKVKVEYERGTVAEVYAKIDRDIEEALPMISESHLDKPKYHFNRRAAYAFAARFNLYYGKWDKAVRYATEAIGEDPTNLLRDWSKYSSFTVISDWEYLYINASEPANFLLIPLYSAYGRVTPVANRYGHNRGKAYQTMWQYFPWGSIVNHYGNGWGNSQVIYVPKVRELFEITDPVAQIGYPHIVLTMFTADETLACRAEANAMLGNFDTAADDLNYWYRKNSPDGSTYTYDQIANYYAQEEVLGADGSVRYSRYPMDSRFGVEAGTQENLVRAALAIRRFDGLFEGIRFPDVKRHGITVEHPVLSTPTTVGYVLKLNPYDPLTAIQLPGDVIYSGLPANPR